MASLNLSLKKYETITAVPFTNKERALVQPALIPWIFLYRYIAQEKSLNLGHQDSGLSGWELSQI